MRSEPQNLGLLPLTGYYTYYTTAARAFTNERSEEKADD